MTFLEPIITPEESPSGVVSKSAVISDCGNYRYCLARSWDVSLPVLVFVMVNPSVADSEIDDPTIRRCMGFARSNGYGGILVVNLFAFRATKPEKMKAVEDPVGPDNDEWLGKAFTYCAKAGAAALAAWGVHGQYRDRDYAVHKLAKAHGVELSCLGKTQGGDPRHPLYVKGDQPFVPLVEAA